MLNFMEIGQVVQNVRKIVKKEAKFLSLTSTSLTKHNVT
jgi:hypothetical protein